MIKSLTALLVRALLKLRYRIKVEGLERIQWSRNVLILPNHPAEIDPVIVATCLWSRLHPRPLMLEKYYRIPVVHLLMRWIGAVPMPDMEVESGHYKRKRVNAAIDRLSDALQAGGNFLFYPSGRLMTAKHERIGGTSGLHTVLQRAPESKVLLVRTRGLWGSMFSKATSGAISPDFVATLKKAAWIALKNFIFLIPKREVVVQFEAAPPDFPRDADVITLNRWLEEWYNRPGDEQPSLVSYSFWKEDLAELKSAATIAVDYHDAPADVRRSVIAKVSEASGIPAAEITPEMRLSDDLALDSLSVAGLISWLDEAFGAGEVEMSQLRTVGAVIGAAAGKKAESQAQTLKPPPPVWTSEAESRPGPSGPEGSTIAEAFLLCAAKMGDHPAVADRASGVLTWRQLKRSVIALAAQLEKLPGERIGVMLPASAAAGVATMATLLAGKVPVMINWTSGRRSIEHAMNSSAVSRVLTSGAFLDRVEADLGFIEDKFLLLETVRERITLSARMAAAVLARCSAASLMKRFNISASGPDSTAVILFTSGSETAPKGVPLSHRNILSNIAGALEALDLTGRDILFGFLPPFHSFGLTVTTILPLVSGTRTFYHPNPNDSRRIGAECRHWLASLLVGTPTFIRNILSAGGTDAFSHLRYLIVGAEKAPEELFDMAKRAAPGAQVLEGYGITECSPIVSANRPGEARFGVGRPLSGVELLIADHQSMMPLPEKERGLVLIRGANVFSGYLGGSPDPFVTVDGKEWYNSGDLGFLQDGRLALAGRLKRFIKVAGEMISLPAIEEALQKRFGAEEKEASFSVVAPESDSSERPPLHLFTTVPLLVDQANEALREAGISILARISDVRQLEALPLLGSGKVDVRALERLLHGRSD